MNIVEKLTARHLKENMSRTVVTTLGICVSVAMITAVFVAMCSFMNLFADATILTVGDFHAQMWVNDEQLKDLREDDRIKTIGVEQDEMSYQLPNFGWSEKKFESMMCADNTRLKQCMTGKYKGKLPMNEKEIAVEQSFIQDNKLNWSIGDTVNLDCGYAYGNESGGSPKFKSSGTQSFKITAILYNNPATTRQYNILRGLNSNTADVGKKENVAAYIALKKLNYKSLDEIKSIVKKYGIDNYNTNKEVLAANLAIDPNSSVASLIPMVAIVLVIIMVASVILIYNAFAMSISERVKYLGMLSSVGATKRQKRASVYYEGLILGMAGIPIGMLAGVAGIAVTLKLIGDKIVSTGMIEGADAGNVSMRVQLPLWVIVGVVVISAVTIFISCLIPAKKASAITPIDAIRGRKEVKLKAKSLKTPKIVKPIFGYEGVIAYKNIKRNGKKANIITASVAISVILFLCCNYFSSLFQQAIAIEADIPYQVTAGVNYDSKEEFLKAVDNMDGINRYYCTVNAMLNVTEENASGYEGMEKFIRAENFTSSYKNLFDGRVCVFVNVVEDKDFNSLCEDNGIPSGEYYGSKMKALLMNNIDHKNDGGKVFTDKVLGNSFVASDDTGVEVAGLVDYDKDNYVCNLNSKNCISLYVPESVYFSNMQNGYYIIGIETEEHEQVAKLISNEFEKGEYSETSISDIMEQAELMNTIAFVIAVFVYGFISLITLITIFNIINTVSTAITMRRKEFAMFRSIGVTGKGFNKMMAIESTMYALRALIFALPISLGLSYLMCIALGSHLIPFSVNIPVYLAVVVAVLLIVSGTMYFSMRKLRQDNIIETLKEDIS